jgi:FKBP-type peptidyl-prolyl cis-trans isomerase (trigger factor)
MPFEATAKAFSLKKLPHSEVELTGEVPYEEVVGYRERALKHLSEHMALPGFRPGKVPLRMALQKLGEVAVLEEALEIFIKDFYPALIAAHRVDAVGRPDVRVTKLAAENPVGLVVRTSVYPEVNLPKNYKTIGKEIELEAVLPATEEEVVQTLENLRQSRKGPASGTEAGPLPDLNDEFAKSVGAFDSLDALKEQLKQGITEEKERKAQEARRGKIINALLKEANIDVPRIFVESELEKIMAQMREDTVRFGLTFETYLEQIKKTEEELRGELHEQAEKRAKLQLMLNKIAEEEKVEANKEAVERELKHALEHFPNAKPELVRIHVGTVLRNEKVLTLLENQEKK